jgi:hypothetical protein
VRLKSDPLWLSVDGEDARRGWPEETDQACIARVRREREAERKKAAYEASPEAALDARRRKVLGCLATQTNYDRGGIRLVEPELDALHVYLADHFLLPADEAEQRYLASRAPIEQLQRAATAARRALPLRPTSTELARVTALEDAAIEAERQVDPTLHEKLLRLRVAADKALEDLRLGRLRLPSPASARFAWGEEDRSLLADLLHKCSDPASVVYGPLGVGLPSGSPSIPTRSLWALAGMSPAGRQFRDDGCDPREADRGRWLVESNDFQRKLSNQLCGALAAKYGLSVASGAAIRRRDSQWGAKSEVLGVASARAV